MKRILYLVAVALVLSGCSDFVEQDTLPKDSVNAAKTIYASIDESITDSRTYIEMENQICWSANDEISYFPGKAFNLQYRFTGNTGDKRGSFERETIDSGVGESLACNYAVYPYVKATTISNAGVISFELPATQHYAENSFGLGANTMVAVTQNTNDESLSFKNVCGYLKLKLYGDNVTVKAISFKGNDNEKIAGAATIMAVYGIDPSVVMSNTATSTITLDCGEGIKLSNDIAKPTVFWFVIPETTFEKGFTVEVTDVDNNIFEQSTSKFTAIKRNKIQPMQVTKFEAKDTTRPAKNEIWYTSTNGDIIEPKATSDFGANVISNTYENGRGVIVFDGEITRIGAGAYSAVNSLASIVIPDGVISIEERAFQNCYNLSDAVIGNGVSSIKFRAFYNCKKLTSLTMGRNVTTIERNSFYKCSNLSKVHVLGLSYWCKITFLDSTANPLNGGAKLCLDGRDITELIIPSDVKEIKSFAFFGCGGLQNIIIHDEVTAIGTQAFYNCSNISRVNIPSSISAIGGSAFSGCSKLSIVDISSLSSWCNIEFTNEWSNPMYYSRKLYLNGREITDLIVPSNVKEIKPYAFYYCGGLKSITIPSSVVSMGQDAFCSCSTFAKLYYQSSLKDWCNINFESKTSNPIKWCSEFYVNGVLVKNIVLPTAEATIGQFAFAYSNCFDSVTINGNIQAIDLKALQACTANYLYINTDIPDATDANERVFCDCNFTNVIVGEGVTCIGDYAFYEKETDNDGNLTNLTIPKSVNYMGDNAFGHRIKSVYISDIAAWCAIEMKDCPLGGSNGWVPLSSDLYHRGNLLEDLIIPEGVVRVGRFENCKSLKSVTIPSTVTEIPEYAFNYCYNISKIYCNVINPPILGLRAFHNNLINGSPKPTATIYVPNESIEKYLMADGWSDYADYIVGYDF